MQITFVGRHIELSDALKNFVTEKLNPLEKRFNQIKSVNVVLHIEKVNHIAEGTAHLNGTEIHATAEAKDMYNAIEIMAEKLLAQITKYKDKLINHHHHD